MAKCEKILITGFSGAGKSSLLDVLESTAPDSDWHFADLDQIVVDCHQKEIPQIIEEHGWDKFRLWERQELDGWLKKEGKGILSLGGGALSQMVLDLYLPSRKILFLHLDAPFEDCWKRLNLENSAERPLLKLGKGELHRIYLERQKIFGQIEWKLENKEKSNLNKLAICIWKKAYE